MEIGCNGEISNVLYPGNRAQRHVLIQINDLDPVSPRHVEALGDFIKNDLRANRTTLYGYREDVLRPKLLLQKPP